MDEGGKDHSSKPWICCASAAAGHGRNAGLLGGTRLSRKGASRQGSVLRCDVRYLVRSIGLRLDGESGYHSLHVSGASLVCSAGVDSGRARLPQRNSANASSLSYDACRDSIRTDEPGNSDHGDRRAQPSRNPARRHNHTRGRRGYRLRPGPYCAGAKDFGLPISSALLLPDWNSQSGASRLLSAWNEYASASAGNYCLTAVARREYRGIRTLVCGKICHLLAWNSPPLNSE